MSRISESAANVNCFFRSVVAYESLYFEAMVGFTQPFFITPCDGRKLRYTLNDCVRNMVDNKRAGCRKPDWGQVSWEGLCKRSNSYPQKLKQP